MSSRYLRNLIVWGIILLVALPFALQLWRRTPRGEEISYTRFIEYIEAGQVERVRIGDGTVVGQLKNGERFYTNIAEGDLLILRRRVAVHDGDLIVARIADKLTVGRLHVAAGRLRLGLGDRAAPSEIEQADLEGKVVALLRRLSE